MAPRYRRDSGAGRRPSLPPPGAGGHHPVRPDGYVAVRPGHDGPGVGVEKGDDQLFGDQDVVWISGVGVPSGWARSSLG